MNTNFKTVIIEGVIGIGKSTLTKELVESLGPGTLYFDEPTNGMDTPSHYGLLELISELHEIQNLTILLVSHLLTDVANYVKKIILIEKNFFQFGRIEEILSEENLMKAYSSSFSVTKLNDEFIITLKHRN